MQMLLGTIRNGHVTLVHATDLPDGTEVAVFATESAKQIGISEEEWPTTPEGVARLLANIDVLEPFEYKPQEELEIGAWREMVKEYTIAKQEATIDGLFR